MRDYSDSVMTDAFLIKDSRLKISVCQDGCRSPKISFLMTRVMPRAGRREAA